MDGPGKTKWTCCQLTLGFHFAGSVTQKKSRRNYMKRQSGWLLLTVACMVFLLGMALFAIPAQAQTFAYVTNIFANTVSVIDTASNTVVATVAVGSGPFGVAITPDGTRAYVANIFDNTVSVIDTAKKTVVATVALGNGPLAVAITPDGTRAYVTGGPVSVIDTASNTVVATAGDPNAYGVAITPDGTREIGRAHV